MGEARRALNVGVLGAQPIASALWYRRGMHSCMAMTLRLKDSDEHILASLAERQGISKQEETVRTIHEAAARQGHEQAVNELSARARERYADLLGRLGR